MGLLPLDSSVLPQPVTEMTVAIDAIDAQRA
jgi:hypothetical protein